MNILFFSRSLPCHTIGGMELVAWDIAEGLARRGHRIKIITTALGESHKDACSGTEHLEIEHLADTRPGQYSRQWWKGSRSAYLREKDNFRPDAVFSVSAGAGSVFPVLDGIPALMQVHGTSFGEFRSKIHSGRFIPIASSVRNLLWIPKDITMYRQVQKVVAIGQAVRDAIDHPLFRWALPENKVTLISNGIDTEMFRPDNTAREKLREKLAIPMTAKVLVWASRLHRQKGTHLALKAFADLRRKDIWFLIIGDGNERRRLERQSCDLGISNRVLFVGTIKHKDLPEWLNIGDAFVFTSIRDEGLPLNILEALSMNLPLVISEHIASPLEGAKEIYKVNPNDTDVLSQVMENAVSSSGGGRSFIEKYYSQKIMLARYEKLLNELVAGNE
ncbi:MAG: glycosyltransferase family 4 protein [Nitrospirota bacterium]|nr:glycosyltransferase family 4 protein [Nitrospirota bacterium]